MLIQIIQFLLEIGVTLVGGAFLLRAVLHYQRAPLARTFEPVARLLRALTDWLHLPLSRVLPAQGRWDGASLLAVWLLKLLQFGLLFVLLGGRWVMWPVAALLGVVQLGLSLLTALVLINVVLSWTGARSPVAQWLARVSEPLLAPLRRIVPTVGGIDFSPLVLLVLVQVASMVLGGMLAQLVGWGVPAALALR